MSLLLLSLLLVGWKPGLNVVTRTSRCRLALWNNSVLCLCKTESEAKLPDTWHSSCSWQMSMNCNGSRYGAEMANAAIPLVPDPDVANLSQVQLAMAPFWNSQNQPFTQWWGCEGRLVRWALGHQLIRSVGPQLALNLHTLFLEQETAQGQHWHVSVPPGRGEQHQPAPAVTPLPGGKAGLEKTPGALARGK